MQPSRLASAVAAALAGALALGIHPPDAALLPILSAVLAVGLAMVALLGPRTPLTTVVMTLLTVLSIASLRSGSGEIDVAATLLLLVAWAAGLDPGPDVPWRVLGAAAIIACLGLASARTTASIPDGAAPMFLVALAVVLVAAAVLVHSVKTWRRSSP